MMFATSDSPALSRRLSTMARSVLAQALGDELAALPPQALQLSKRMMKHAQRPMLHETLKYEFELFSERLQSEEAQAAVAKLLKK